MSGEKGGARGVGRTWLVYALLFVFSVPWYFPAGTGEPFVLGFPLWSFVSLCCYIGVSLLTIWRIDRLWEHQVVDLERAQDNGPV